MAEYEQNMRFHLKCGAQTLHLSERTHIMGILNVTPDSFSDGGDFIDPEKAVQRGVEMVQEGADIIDVGGESTRPGANPVSTDEEIRRIVPVIKKLSERISNPISVDTMKSEVARAAVESGAVIINDVSGLVNDPEIIKIAAETRAALIIMHMRGMPRTMQDHTEYQDMIKEIIHFLDKAARKALKGGVNKSAIVIDPGIGFGKNIKDNFKLIHELPKFRTLKYPILMGVSRKSFIGKSLDKPVDQRLIGSMAAVSACILKGAHIVRVHDVAAAVETAKIIDLINQAA